MDPNPSITSPKNPLVRRFQDAARGAPPEVMLAEGIKLVSEALEAKVPVEEAVVGSRLLGSELGRNVRRRLEREAGRIHEVSDPVLERISGVKTPQGVLAILRRPAYQRDDLLARGAAPLVVVAAGVKDPGNLGALVRVAEAAGASGLLALQGGADPYRDKALRGSAGSVFRLPTLGEQRVEDVVALAKQHRLQIVVAEAQAAAGREVVAYWDVDWRKPTLLVLGNEGEGVPEALAAAAGVHTRIDMAPPVESLNVAVAAGVLLFAARRQRA